LRDEYSATSLDGKTVLITGAGSGLGRAFALGFARAGARIVAADINAAGAGETAALVRDAGGTGIACTVDVTVPASIGAMLREIVERFERVDVLVNNAAIYAGLRRSRFEDIDPAEWDRVMAVNLKGPWLCAALLLPHLASPGRIINIASATVLSGSPLWMHYVASKGGVIAMTRVMARELGDRNVTVNVIAPGFTLTEASLAIMPDAATYGVERGAIKRACEPDDIVGTALFLASDASAYMTGQTLVVDGGKQFI
jgi:NAD(P)-dependent dehydrogenase (short-subunit alcohol dehydrogenase family)